MTDAETQAFATQRAVSVTTDASLLPCPFCGGEALLNDESILDEKCFVGCPECDIMRPNYYTDKSDAIQQWNTRAAAAPVVSREDALDALDETMIYLKCVTDKTKQTIRTLLEAAAKENS